MEWGLSIMNSKITIEPENFKNNTRKIIIDLAMVDLMRAKPSRMAIMAHEVYEKTNKVSDLLFWLSEEFEAIEESTPPQSEEEK